MVLLYVVKTDSESAACPGFDHLPQQVHKDCMAILGVMRYVPALVGAMTITGNYGMDWSFPDQVMDRRVQNVAR